MPTFQTPEIFWLTLTALMTGLLWLPYILKHIVETGLWRAISDADISTTPKAGWGIRAKRAHANAAENLVVFAPLALAVVLTGAGGGHTATACMVYFLARAVHYVVATLGVPVLRTLTFFIGVGAQVTLAMAVLKTL